MEAYNITDQKMHQLAQTLTKFNRSYASSKPDDSHTNLALDPVADRLVGRWVSTADGDKIMGLCLKDFRIKVYSRTWEVLYETDIEGVTQESLEKQLEEILPQLGLKPDGFGDSLHYEIPGYEFAEAPISGITDTEMAIWIEQRALANEACQWLLNHLQLSGEIRIWPHHFDTGIYVEPTAHIGFGFGLAMKDEMVGSPYYYFSAYGLHDNDIDYQLLSTLGHGQWLIKENWMGAILRLQEVNRSVLELYIKEVANEYFGL